MALPELLPKLQSCLQERRITVGIALLETERSTLLAMRPGDPCAGETVGCLAQWLDVGFQDGGMLASILQKFDANERRGLRLAEYLQLRLAEAQVAMREEELASALGHLNTVLSLGEEAAGSEISLIATFWKARCLRKAGEYRQALEVTRDGMCLAGSLGFRPMKAVMQTLESWIVFQNGDAKEAVRILQEAETVLRDTDDYITLGNIQSAYGRIALREGRYDHALKYFELSIGYFKERDSLAGYLARSLTNMAQAKRFLALQLRRNMDATWERQRRTPFDQFIRRADGKRDAHGEETEHFSAPDVLPAKQDLSRDERGHETLEEVPELVVRVALQAE